MNRLSHGPDKVHADVALVLGLVDHLEPHRGEELEPDQGGDLAVDGRRGVDLLLHDVVEDGQQSLQGEWFGSSQLGV